MFAPYPAWTKQLNKLRKEQMAKSQPATDHEIKHKHMSEIETFFLRFKLRIWIS